MCCAVLSVGPFGMVINWVPVSLSFTSWSRPWPRLWAMPTRNCVITKGRIESALKAEEEQFSRTLDNGMQLLDSAIAELEGDTLAGETVFRLYDTYGFPV